MPALMLAACSGGGDKHAEAKALIATNCASCHTVPGVPTAKGRIGPSLAGIASRPLIAGTLPNTPTNLRRWIQHPQAIKPGTAMTEAGLTPQQVNLIADYLDTLDKP
jgi:cytochrome c